MNIKSPYKKLIKSFMFKTPIMKDYLWAFKLYKKYMRFPESQSLASYLLLHHSHFYLCPDLGSKAKQVARLLQHIDIQPVDNYFFYSIDCFKTLANKSAVYGNCTGDIDMLVHGAFLTEEPPKDNFGMERNTVQKAMRNYLTRCYQTPKVEKRYRKQLDAAASLFERPAVSLFEALQRILFFDQFVWQTGHTLVGLGHLDWILDDLYRHDIYAGILTRDRAKELLRGFLLCLHECYWFKSAALMGDTGQIVILGGRGADGKYHCNELTYLFIEVSEELKLPDPKVLLRCTADMPEDLLEAAVDCIATGIGAPLLSNDDTVIPAMRSCGYEEADACNYGTSACWEPLVPGVSCEANNIASLNFVIPFTRMLSTPQFDGCASLDELQLLYMKHLSEYIEGLLTPLTGLELEKDPLLSLVSPSAEERRKDITQGGAKYNNMGLTSVGLGTVVNSLLNLKKLVFEEKRYTLQELNDLRRSNYSEQDSLLRELKNLQPCFGCDDAPVVALTKQIIAYASGEFEKYRTKLGGRFKFGLSSPSYISGADKVPATFDGRRDADPFSVHISSGVAVPTTELLSFAMQLDYDENRINGNVIDFITSPGILTQNIRKYAALLRAGFAGGIFQLQMNVVDSATLIAAKADPTLFPNLVVRVWGFSAYFNDLPEEYKDVLIARAIESEKAA